MHHRAFGQPGDLAVLGERDVEPERVLERTSHQQRVLHAVAVVGEDPHADGGEFGERGELVTVPADGDRRCRKHVAQPGPHALAADEVDDLDAVLRRVGVRHGDDRGEAAERRGTAAGLDRLGLFLAGLAQVDVEVDESGAHHTAGGVDQLVSLRSSSSPRGRCRRR